MSRPNPLTKHQHSTSGGLERIGPLLADLHPDHVISKRRMRKVESIECVRLNREAARQNLGFSSRPFVLCGLPVKRHPVACFMNGGTASSFCRSPGIRTTVCPGDKIGLCRYFWLHLRSDSRGFLTKEPGFTNISPTLSPTSSITYPSHPPQLYNLPCYSPVEGHPERSRKSCHKPFSSGTNRIPRPLPGQPVPKAASAPAATASNTACTPSPHFFPTTIVRITPGTPPT